MPFSCNIDPIALNYTDGSGMCLKNKDKNHKRRNISSKKIIKSVVEVELVVKNGFSDDSGQF